MTKTLKEVKQEIIDNKEELTPETMDKIAKVLAKENGLTSAQALQIIYAAKATNFSGGIDELFDEIGCLVIIVKNFPKS